MKKAISLLLCLAMLFSVATVAAADGAQAALRSVYGDGMLFKQNEDAVFEGVAQPGAVVNASLYDSANALVSEGSAVTNAEGVFSVSLAAPEGSFEEYTVVLTADSKEFRRLEDVVFGELWLASGQSNMMYPLAQEKVGSEMYENGEKSSKWLRVFLEPAYPEYNNSVELVPVAPQADIKGGRWITGESDDIYGMSAVAFFFASEMLEKLEMPVGILNSSLGGSTIASWLSREAIDNCPEVKNILTKKGRYIEEGKWNEATQNIYHDMTANFNLRTNAYKNFSLSGMIWYQGESDLMFGYTPQEYAAQLELLQDFYTSHFNYKNGRLPLVFTQLASFMYSEDGYELADWNIGYTEFCAKSPESRAVITNYDIPSTFGEGLGAIHPECKKEVGERMAFAANGLVYDAYESYSAPYPINSETVDSSVFVTFENVGDGLTADGGMLRGFAMCDSRGIYVQADAEIISNDTIRVYCDSVTSPVSVTYAYSVGNYCSNLYSAMDGQLALPVSPFIIGAVSEPHYWADKAWADCEESVLWHNYSDSFGGSYKAWAGENAKVKITETAAYSGACGLNVTSDCASFAAKPVLTYKNGAVNEVFDEADSDYSDYGSISFFIRNNGTQEVALDTVEFYENSLACYVPVEFSGFVIPADGKWYKVEVAFDSFYCRGDKTGAIFSNNVLDDVKDIKLLFSAEGESDISVDNIRFVAEENTSSSSPVFGIFENINSVLSFILSLIFRILG